jgi:hypothetical protein
MNKDTKIVKKVKAKPVAQKLDRPREIKTNRDKKIEALVEPHRAALSISRGDGKNTVVNTSSLNRFEREQIEKKDGGGSKRISRITKDELKAVVAEVIKEQKPRPKRKQYASRTSTILRVPNELLPTVKKMIAGYRTKRREDPDSYR